MDEFNTKLDELLAAAPDDETRAKVQALKDDLTGPHPNTGGSGPPPPPPPPKIG